MRIGCLIPRLLMCLTWPCVGQTTYYVHGGAGDDAANGLSPQTAWNTLAHAANQLASGDTLYHRGVFAEPAVTFSHLTDVKVLKDPAAAELTMLDGGVVITQWGDPVGTAYPVVSPSTRTLPPTVTENYSQDMDGSRTGIAGAYYGHLKRTTSLQECMDTPGSWMWDQTARQLYVHPTGSLDPRTSGAVIRWGRERSAIQLQLVERFTVAGFKGVHWCDFTGGGRGMTVHVHSGRDVIIEKIEAYDCGWHAIGVAGYFSLDNTVRDALMIGSNWDAAGSIRHTPAGASPIVFAGTQAGGSNPTNAGNVGERLRIVMSPLRGTDGSPLVDADHPPDSFYGAAVLSHGWIGDPMNDVEWRFVDVVVPDPRWNVRFVAANTHEAPPNPDDFDTYHVRISDSRYEGRSGAVPANVAVRRTVWKIAGGDAYEPDSVVWPQWSNAFNLFENCVFHVEVRQPGATIMQINGSHRLRTDHCAFYSASPAGGVHGLFVRVQSSLARWEAVHCIFARAAVGSFCTINASAQPPVVSMTRCLYADTLDPTAFSSSGPPGAPKSLQNWIDTVDPAGIYTANPRFTNPLAGDFRPQQDSPAIDAGHTPAMRTTIELDINRQPRVMESITARNTGIANERSLIVDIGPYEAHGPTCWPDGDHSSGKGVLDVFDFLFFLNAFSQQLPYACDCDESTGVDVCDVFDYLCFANRFHAGCF